MKRSEFRAYFESDPVDRFANFDRSGNASVAMPYPTTSDARNLINYPTVVELDIGFHKPASSAEPLKTLLLGWKSTLKRLRMQDFRLKRKKDIEIFLNHYDFFGELKVLYDLQITQLPVSIDLLMQVATLKKLRNLHLSCATLSTPAIEAIARSTSLKEVLIINCEGVSKADEKILVAAGLPPKNVRINRSIGDHN